jgi:hypothetical protein
MKVEHKSMEILDRYANAHKEDELVPVMRDLSGRDRKAVFDLFGIEAPEDLRKNRSQIIELLSEDFEVLKKEAKVIEGMDEAIVPTDRAVKSVHQPEEKELELRPWLSQEEFDKRQRRIAEEKLSKMLKGKNKENEQTLKDAYEKAGFPDQKGNAPSGQYPKWWRRVGRTL